jgi:hypothetical protein
MSVTAQFNLRILWEHELRAAAKALKDLDTKLQQPGEVPVDPMPAINACAAALFGCDDPDGVLVLSHLPNPARRKRT